MSNEPLPAQRCRLTFRNQSARRGVEEGCSEYWVGGPIPVAFPRDSVLGIEEKKRKERAREDEREEEDREERNSPLAHGISHPPPYLYQGRYRLQRSPALASQSNFA